MSATKDKGKRRSMLIVCALVAVHFLLVFLAGSIPWQKPVFIFFVFSLVILPGYIAASMLFPRARFYYALLFSFILGTTQIFVLLLIFSILDIDIYYISILVPILCIILAFYRYRGAFEGYELPRNLPLSRTVILIMLVLTVLVSILTLGIGDPFFYMSDTQDHVAYIRAIARSHEVFPGQFIYRDGGTLTRDIRRGLLHPVWGTAGLLASRADIDILWPAISWIGALFLLLSIFCLGIQLFGDQSIAVTGVILYILFFQMGLAGPHLLTVAYGFHFGKIYLYAFIIFSLLYARTARKEFLLSAAAASFGAVGTHVSYLMIIPFFVAVMIASELLRGDSTDRRRLLSRTLPWLAGAVSAINLPYLLIRYFRDFHPANEIHTHVHGLLYFTDDLAVLNPFLFFQADGILMIVSLAAVFLLWRKCGEDGNLRLLLMLTAGFYLLVFNPLWVPLIMERITYLIVRFSVAVPTMLVSAYLVHALWRRIRGASGPPSIHTAVAGGIITVLLLLPYLVTDLTYFAYGGKRRERVERASAKSFGDLYDILNKRVPAGSVIAADPLTSYCILAFTDHYVVCTYDQHSTPNDSTALDRIRKVRDMYLPSTSCGDITAIMDEYGAEYIVTNGRIPRRRVRSEYWKPDRESAKAAAAMLSNCSDSFEEIYSHDSIHLFSYIGGTGGVTGNAVTHASETPVFLKGYYTGDYTGLEGSGVDGIYLHGWRIDRETVSRGETLELSVDWLAEIKKEFASYVMYVRFDTEFEKGSLYRPWYGKIYRKAVERSQGERYRFRIDHLPFNGIYPPDKWQVGQVLSDTIEVPIPTDIAAGAYTISVRLHKSPHVSNLRMKDLLTDDDFYDGPDLMTVIIE